MADSEDHRASDALRAVDGLLKVQLQGGPFGARPLANLAVAMAIEFSNAEWGVLLLDEGEGLRPVLTLEERIDAATGPVREPDPHLLREAGLTRSVVRDGRRLAAPILDSGRARGMLYLEGPAGGFDAATADLVLGVATTVGALLQSGQLVEELSRRTRDMEMLEALGACLAAGAIGSEELERTLDAALRATRSLEGMLALFDAEGDLVELLIRGERARTLDRLGPGIAEQLLGCAPQEVAGLVGSHHLLGRLRSALSPAPAGTPGGPVGFLLVRGEGPYRDGDRSFFNALVHLLDGALARVDYFRRAAEDPLTETGSRLALQLKLWEAEQAARRTGRPFSIILVDLDHFKEINDRHGHLAGDAMLKEVAALLRSRLRAQDAVARYGGDEFVVILPATAAGDAERLAGELRRLAAEGRFTEHRLPASLSMGVASWEAGDAALNDLLARADRALYRSKEAGRNRVTVDPGSSA